MKNLRVQGMWILVCKLWLQNMILPTSKRNICWKKVWNNIICQAEIDHQILSRASNQVWSHYPHKGNEMTITTLGVYEPKRDQKTNFLQYIQVHISNYFLQEELDLWEKNKSSTSYITILLKFIDKHLSHASLFYSYFLLLLYITSINVHVVPDSVRISSISSTLLQHSLSFQNIRFGYVIESDTLLKRSAFRPH